MPKSKEEILSPPRPQRSGSKQLAENLSKDELLRRLKKVAHELSDAEQGENLEDYLGTVTVLGRTFIIKHSDKDVRFYAACCLAHVLRIYAPEPPYDTNQLWSIFDLIISQLEGLKHAKSKGEKGASYERLFHLLETLAVVKTLILCVQLEFMDLILKFFKIIFSSVRDEHSKKVKNFMLDIMSTLLSETDTVPQELLDIMLENIINPKKTSNKAAYELASALIDRTATSIEAHIQQFFNNALFFEKASESKLEDSLYDVLYELYKICPSVLLSVLPQLEFKLKSVDKDERIPVAALLGKMFSDEESTLAQSHKPLWHCFLGRFVDIDIDVRIECIKHAKFFFLYHPELVGEITEKLLHRQRDPDQKVRMEVVTAICDAASENISKISQQLFDVIIERLRDRRFDVRKDTMMSLGRLYKKMSAADVNADDKAKVSWVPTKIVHCYYRNTPEERIHVERVFLGCLVPVSLPSRERMKRLFTAFQTLDEPGVRAFTHMLKSQASLRSDMNDILKLWEEHQTTSSEEAKKILRAKITAVARVLPEPARAQEHLKTVVKMLSQKNLLNLMKICLGSDQDCAKVTEAVKEVVVKFGVKNPVYDTIKAILDRAAPLLIDKSSAKELVTLVTKCVNHELLDDDLSSEEDSETFDRDEVSTSGRKALDLLLICITVFPKQFKFSLIFEHLLMYLKKDDVLVDYALKILEHIGPGLEEIDSSLFSHYQPVLSKIFTTGKLSQVKLAARILTKIYPSSSTIFERIWKNRLESLDYESSSLLTSLSCISAICLHAPAVFEPHHTAVIRDFVVKEILMKDRGKNTIKGTLWCDEEELSKEVQAKICGLKILVNWLRGKPVNPKVKVESVITMLDKAVEFQGDITRGGRLRPCEMSHMRLTAACGLLKLAQIPDYHSYLEIKHVQRLSSVIKDSCIQVRESFAKKLSKGLDSLKMPLEYLALFSFYGKEAIKDLKQQTKQMILRNINMRNEYLKQQKSAPERSASLLPEYAMPYLIYMLSHLPTHDYTKSSDLGEIKEYLWFFMECILTRGDNHNFMKKLAENIKQTKDANAEETDKVNQAIYVVCDIVIGIIVGISKARTSLLKDYPADIALPRKLFSPLGKGKVNDKTYLPTDFVVSPVKRTTNVIPKITPTKPTIGSSNKKKTLAEKLSTSVSEASKGKKIQKSLLGMLDKNDDENDVDNGSDTEEEETSARKETSHRPAEKEKEEMFTKVSPRKKTKTSSRQNVRSSTKETTKDVFTKPTPSERQAVSAREKRTKKSATQETAKDTLTKSPATKKRQINAETISSPNEKRTKKSPAKVLKEEKPTRYSPRRNPKSAVEENKVRTNLDEVKRILDKEDYPNEKTPMAKRAKDSLGELEVNGTSQDTSDGSQTVVPSPTKGSLKKRKIVDENNEENTMEQSTLVVKRKRKRR